MPIPVARVRHEADRDVATGEQFHTHVSNLPVGALSTAKSAVGEHLILARAQEASVSRDECEIVHQGGGGNEPVGRIPVR